jgi:hypothetical protein
MLKNLELFSQTIFKTAGAHCLLQAPDFSPAHVSAKLDHHATRAVSAKDKTPRSALHQIPAISV